MKSTKIQSNMRTRITLIICLCLFAVGRASAQWAVIDPSNIAQSIVNTSKNVVHTSTTAQSMIKNFQETVKIYEQSHRPTLREAIWDLKDSAIPAKEKQRVCAVGDDSQSIYSFRGANIDNIPNYHCLCIQHLPSLCSG